MRSEEEVRAVIDRLAGTISELEDTRQPSDWAMAYGAQEALKWTVGDIDLDELGPSGAAWFSE